MEIQRLAKEKTDEFYFVFSEILREGFPEYSSELIEYFINKEFSPWLFREKIDAGEWTVLTAIDEGKTLGFLVYEKLYGGVSYCQWVGVLKESRGKRIGRRLIEKWKNEVLAAGGHKLVMLTQSQINRQIFPKYGFKEEGYEEKSWFGLDCWLFGKIIAPPKPEVFLK